jgi:hypothetical protein
MLPLMMNDIGKKEFKKKQKKIQRSISENIEPFYKSDKNITHKDKIISNTKNYLLQIFTL